MKQYKVIVTDIETTILDDNYTVVKTIPSYHWDGLMED